jgi:hypothetical protein
MSEIKQVENNAPVGEKGGHEENLTTIPSFQKTDGDFCADINNVAALGFDNVAELEKKIIRRLDMFMMPQLWILYMFNYLNRTNIAQARLNTFDEDLNLQDGDYQVRRAKGVASPPNKL